MAREIGAAAKGFMAAAKEIGTGAGEIRPAAGGIIAEASEGWGEHQQEIGKP